MKIIADTREKQGFWRFIETDAEVVRAKLDTGDYSIEGLEHLLTIERKKTPQELSQSLLAARFKRELDRMIEIPHSYILCEFTLEDLYEYPQKDKLPPRVFKKIQVKGPFLVRKVCEIMRDYPHIHFVFCHRCLSEEIAFSILKSIARKNGMYT